MSFASETKNELCKTEPESCCRKAECYGLLLFGRSFTLDSICLITENGEAARRAALFAAQVTGTAVDIRSSLIRRKENRSAFTVSVPGENQRNSVLAEMGHTGREINLRINLANVENDCCRAAFLRGAFLACGTLTDPQKDYRMEFVVPYMNLAKDLVRFIRDIYEINVEPRLISRKGSYVISIKGSEYVSDFLTFLGAGNAAMELIQIRMLKEVRNNVNRKTNFETANLDKTASAAALYTVAINKIMTAAGIDGLPEDLRELARLRRDNPEMSLRELGRNLSMPLSRSGVYHRLKRIVDIADKL